MSHKFGATGRYPFGRLNADDEGELAIGVAVDKAQGVIVLAFGKPISWMGLPSEKAREMAKLLSQKADELDQAKA